MVWWVAVLALGAEPEAEDVDAETSEAVDAATTESGELHPTDEDEVTTEPQVLVVHGPVVGMLPPDTVEAVVGSAEASYLACFSSALGAYPELAGQLGLKVTVERRGDVVLVEVENDTLMNEGVSDCVKDALMALSMPDTPGYTHVHLDLHFQHVHASR